MISFHREELSILVKRKTYVITIINRLRGMKKHGILILYAYGSDTIEEREGKYEGGYI